MEIDPQLNNDDNTSFASSQSLMTNSEDADDLRLGAEANTFTPDSENANGVDATVNSFLIIRRGHSHEEEDSFFTFSTISRYYLGSILPLTQTPPHLIHQIIKGTKLVIYVKYLMYKSDKVSNASSKELFSMIGYDARDGIVKAQEWLNTQQNDSDASQFSNLLKDTLQGYKVNTSGIGRKIAAQKKRLKWSKSRQSSFEQLLPNVQEESAVEVQESENRSCKEESSIQPIRESSKEKENYVPEANEILHVLADPSLRHLSARKCANLINMKVDSFELEEVLSNDGFSATPYRAATNTSIVNSSDPAEGTAGTDGRDWEMCKPPSSVGSIDSSSGFDEGPDDGKTSTDESHHTVVEKCEKLVHYTDEPSAKLQSDMHEDSMKFNGLSTKPSSDTPENSLSYVSPQCSCKENSGYLIPLILCLCIYNIVGFNRKSTNDGKPYCSDCQNSGGLLKHELMEGKSELSESQRSTASLDSAQSMQYLSQRPLLHSSKISSKSSSNLNKNANNSVNNAFSRSSNGKLQYAHSFYSSLPTLPSHVCPNGRAEDCELVSHNQRRVTSSSSLMTSIADVAYLSYRRLLTENHEIRNSSRGFDKPECSKSNTLQNHAVPP